MADSPTIDKTKIFSDLIKKHITVFGSDITFAQLKHIPELDVDDQGNVKNISQDTKEVQEKLFDLWNQLSPFLAKQIAQPELNKITN